MWLGSFPSVYLSALCVCVCAIIKALQFDTSRLRSRPVVQPNSYAAICDVHKRDSSSPQTLRINSEAGARCCVEVSHTCRFTGRKRAFV